MSRSNTITTSGPAPLTMPAAGVPIATEGACSYRDRRSAERQAAYWAEAVADEPDCAGFTVAVGALKVDGRWPLVWEVK